MLDVIEVIGQKCESMRTSHMGVLDEMDAPYSLRFQHGLLAGAVVAALLETMPCMIYLWVEGCNPIPLTPVACTNHSM